MIAGRALKASTRVRCTSTLAHPFSSILLYTHTHNTTMVSLQVTRMLNRIVRFLRTMLTPRGWERWVCLSHFSLSAQV
jgi:hypothetical protein